MQTKYSQNAARMQSKMQSKFSLVSQNLSILFENWLKMFSNLFEGDWNGSAEASSRPTCDNHDDNETLAIILCDSCGNLCADCDRFLHLHRKTKNHQRQIFKEEEDSIKVDLHEGKVSFS